MKKMMLLFSALAFSIFLPSPATADFKRTKVAVLDFQLKGKEYDTADMGKIVAEWLMTALVKDGRFEVVDRGLLKKALGKENLGVNGLEDKNSVKKLGELLGVKVIISGSVMKFQDFLVVNARIIDVESASIITAEKVKSTTAVQLEELVEQMAEKIIKVFPLTGYVVFRNNDRVTIDLGSRAGVKRGMQFIAYREGDVIKHPKTGEVLDVKSIQTGVLEIDIVKEKTSDGMIIRENETGTIEYGQLVKSVLKSFEPTREHRQAAVHKEPTATPLTKYSEPAIPKKPERRKRMSDVEHKLSEIDPILEKVIKIKATGNVQWEVKYKQMMQQLKAIYARYPTSPFVYYYYGKVYGAIDEIRRANKSLEKALYYDSKFKEALILKGDINYNYGKKIPLTAFRGKSKRNQLGIIAQEAYEAAANIEQDNTSKAMLYFKIGNVYAELSDHKEKAEQYWQKAVSIAPQSNAAQLAYKKLKK
jgi:TolB-like protein/tetratricopeptide (TPR) repeat protein